MTPDQVREYATLAAIAASAFWFKWESIKASRERQKTQEQVQQVHIMVDGRLKQLLEAKDALSVSKQAEARTTGHAEGVKQEEDKAAAKNP